MFYVNWFFRCIKFLSWKYKLSLFKRLNVASRRGCYFFFNTSEVVGFLVFMVRFFITVPLLFFWVNWNMFKHDRLLIKGGVQNTPM